MTTVMPRKLDYRNYFIKDLLDFENAIGTKPKKILIRQEALDKLGKTFLDQKLSGVPIQVTDNINKDWILI